MMLLKCPYKNCIKMTIQNISIQVSDKPKTNIDREIKASNSKDVVNLEEVQAIKNATNEYFIFIGLDRANNVRNISLLGIGTSSNILIDSKDIIKTAILSASEKVILVHNHPSNNLKPSKEDLHLTNVTNEILKPFNIELIDHIIVTEKEYSSILEVKAFYKQSKGETLENMSKGFLLEENQKLKKEIEQLKQQLQNKQVEQEYEEELEM